MVMNSYPAEYHALHRWLRKCKPRPELCEECDMRRPRELATIDGKYIKDLNHFKWLCTSCHKELDYKLGIRKPNYTRTRWKPFRHLIQNL